MDDNLATKNGQIFISTMARYRKVTYLEMNREIGSNGAMKHRLIVVFQTPDAGMVCIVQRDSAFLRLSDPEMDRRF